MSTLPLPNVQSARRHFPYFKAVQHIATKAFTWRLIPIVLCGTFVLYFFPFPPLHSHYGPVRPHRGPGEHEWPHLPPPPPPPIKRPSEDFTTNQESTSSDEWNSRASKVKEAFTFAWKGYREYAFPSDEIKPLSGPGKVDNFNGWGVTMFDALDTIWVLGLEDFWDEVVQSISKNDFEQKESEYAPFFETVIRYLGGLLSAYGLSGEPVLLEKADELADGLLQAFNTTSGFPKYAVNIKSGKTRSGWTSGVLWAEALSCQMEYKYLAHLTGRSEYYHKVEDIMDKMYETDVNEWSFPTMWSLETGRPINEDFSVGAFADSAHEYLLKQYLMSGMSEPKVLDLYLKSANSIIKKLLYVTPNRGLLYVTNTIAKHPSHKFEHLSCFLPGLLALGAQRLDLPDRDKELHQWAAKGLAYTCYITYADQYTGLGPDEMIMNYEAQDISTEDGSSGGFDVSRGRWLEAVEEWERQGRPGGIPPGLAEVKPEKKSSRRDYSPTKAGWYLRPEVIESIFIMWKTTGEVAWRERGWEIFQSIEKHSRKDHGYASLLTVDSKDPYLRDETPSYFFAETLKYLYLMFSETDPLPLDKWVFNTEAHPLPVFQWKEWEKKEYGIS